jgi:hypothetical protein
VTAAPATVTTLWAAAVHECLGVTGATRRDRGGGGISLSANCGGGARSAGGGRAHGKSALRVSRVKGRRVVGLSGVEKAGCLGGDIPSKTDGLLSVFRSASAYRAA